MGRHRIPLLVTTFALVAMAAVPRAKTALPGDGANAASTPKAEGSAPDAPRARRPARRGGCGPVPATLRRPPASLDVFYQQYCDVGGFAVAGSAAVDPRALEVAASRLRTMTSRLPSDVKRAMRDAGVRFTIMAQSEKTRDVPEFAHLRTTTAGIDVNHTRGVFTGRQAVALSPEENMLCLDGDGYRGSDVFVHEFAHALHRKGFDAVRPRFDAQLETIFQRAMRRGLWEGSYATTNRREYWAVGVQTWYGVNGWKSRYPVQTRAQLKRYDPELYTLIAGYLPASDLQLCTGG